MQKSDNSTEGPFVPGARVAVRDSRWGDIGYREDFVEKVYKTGRFTLKAGKSNQQWRPSIPVYLGDPWLAYPTGNDSWDRRSLKIWNSETDAEISASIAKANRLKRVADLRKRIELLPADQVTDAMLDLIESALPSAKVKTSDQ